MKHRNKASKIQNVIIISQDKNLHSTVRLIEESKRSNIRPFWINPLNASINLFQNENKIFSINKYENTTIFHRTTGINFDDFDLLLTDYLKAKLNAKVVNSVEHIQLLRDKSKQNLFFNTNNIPYIPTFLFRGNTIYNNDIHKFIKHTKSTTNKNDFILKTIRGNQGLGVNIIHGEDSLLSILETLSVMQDQRFIIQPFYKKRREFRVFIIQNEIMGIIEKTFSNTSVAFRGNSRHDGIKTNFYKNSECSKFGRNFLNTIEKFKSAINLSYTGIDIMEYDGQFLVMESNLIPGFKQFEALSKINIAKELLHSFIDCKGRK